MSDEPQGTPLEDIEMGQVKNEADAATMRELMADINGGNGDQGGEFPTGGREEFPTQAKASRMAMPTMPSMMPMRGGAMPPMQPHPSQMYEQHQQYEQQYDEEEQEQEQEQEQPRPKYKASSAAPKKNTWSTVIETIRDPLIVGILIFVLSLPSLHTFVGRHASWAYKVGGQLSWVGLALTAAVGVIAFGLYRAVLDTIAK